jgi:phosphatidylglycerophosphatase A
LSRRGAETLKLLCITVLGSGFLRPAPATWASFFCVLIFAPLWWLGATIAGSRSVIEVGLVIGVLVSSGLSVRWGRWAIERFGSKDPKNFVLDEFAGQWLALLWLPIGLSAGVEAWLCVAGGQFVLFRIMDIVKPPPAFQLQRLRDGWGILVDDLVAGLYANLAGQLLWRLTPLAAWIGIRLSGP